MNILAQWRDIDDTKVFHKSDECRQKKIDSHFIIERYTSENKQNKKKIAKNDKTKTNTKIEKRSY